MDSNFITDAWVAIKSFSPGALGAAFAALSGPARKRVERVIEFSGGLGLAVVGTEPMLHYFKLETGVYWSVMAFSIGFAGLSITSKVLSTLRELDVAGIIRDKLK